MLVVKNQNSKEDIIYIETSNELAIVPINPFLFSGNNSNKYKNPIVILPDWQKPCIRSHKIKEIKFLESNVPINAITEAS